jgi:hypothetical protein
LTKLAQTEGLMNEASPEAITSNPLLNPVPPAEQAGMVATNHLGGD